MAKLACRSPETEGGDRPPGAAGDSSGSRALKQPCAQKARGGGQLANCVMNICPTRGDSYSQGPPVGDSDSAPVTAWGRRILSYLLKELFTYSLLN